MKAPRAKPAAPEALPLRHSFFKGGHYENMKGTYEVLAVDGNTMRIRWESGEESETDLQLQDRILRRFEREVRATKVRLTPRQQLEAEAEPRLAAPFRGLVATDFTREAADTTWRSRTSGIGSLVTQALEATEFCFGFSVPFQRPIVLWADLDQCAGSAAGFQTGFSCRLDEARAYYGFFVERSTGEDGKGKWHRFLEWLKEPEHEEWLRSLAAGNGLKIFDGSEPSSFVQPSGTGWVRVDGGHREDVPSLSAFLETRPDEPGAVECVAVLEKDRAVLRGVKLERDIVQLFELLMPLYRGALGVQVPAPCKPGRQARKRKATTTAP